MTSKFTTEQDTFLKVPNNQSPPNGYEAGMSFSDHESRVIVGASVRMRGGDVTTLRIQGRRLDPLTGELSDEITTFHAGTEPFHPLESSVSSENLLSELNEPNDVLTGLWVRAHPGTVTTLTLWTKSIDENGQLVNLQPIHLGRDPLHQTEVTLILDEPFVAVGVGMRSDDGNVTHMMGEFSTLNASDELVSFFDFDMTIF